MDLWDEEAIDEIRGSINMQKFQILSPSLFLVSSSSQLLDILNLIS